MILIRQARECNNRHDDRETPLDLFKTIININDNQELFLLIDNHGSISIIER